MFKFLKSKKGFTLVELMIVVVIMAILVAVAVPIYNAVTENARKKTCQGNQRNIISQITNTAMSDPSFLKITAADTEGANIVIKTNDKGDDVAATDGINDAAVCTKSGAFAALFNDDNKPFCPTKNAVLTVNVKVEASGAIKVDVVSCKVGDTNTGHVA